MQRPGLDDLRDRGGSRRRGHSVEQIARIPCTALTNVGVVAVALVLAPLACGSTGSDGSRSPSTSTPRATAPPKVELIGDSMAREARRDIALDGRGAGLDLSLDLRGQAAPCSQESAVIAALGRRPKLVAI